MTYTIFSHPTAPSLLLPRFKQSFSESLYFGPFVIEDMQKFRRAQKAYGAANQLIQTSHSPRVIEKAIHLCNKLFEKFGLPVVV